MTGYSGGRRTNPAASNSKRLSDGHQLKARMGLFQPAAKALFCGFGINVPFETWNGCASFPELPADGIRWPLLAHLK